MNNQYEFAEKVTVITDIANPYGRALAMQLAMSGAFVVGGNSNPMDENSVKSLTELGTLAQSIAITLEGESITNVIKKANETFGRIDFLINTSMASLDASSRTTLDIFEGSFFAYLRATNEAIPLLKQRPKGKIVNLAWVGEKNSGNQAIFLAASEAIETYMQNVGLPENVFINGVKVFSKKGKRGADEALNELLRDSVKPDPDDVARAIYFLLSGEARAVRGQTLVLG